MCEPIFSTSFVWNISYSEKNEKSQQIFMKITRFLLRILSYLNLWTDFRSLEIQNFVKIRPVGAEFFQADRLADGQTDTSNESISAVLRKGLKTDTMNR